MGKPLVPTIVKGLNGKEANTPTGRGSNGRFVKGWKGGPGNPHVKRQAALRKALYEAISSNDVTEVIGAMLTAAKKGDVQAAKLILNYVVTPNPLLEGNEDDTTISVVARIPRSQAIDIMSTSAQDE